MESDACMDHSIADETEPGQGMFTNPSSHGPVEDNRNVADGRKRVRSCHLRLAAPPMDRDLFHTNRFDTEGTVSVLQ